LFAARTTTVSSRWKVAASAQCRHQAFRVGRAAYGLQFSLEVTPEMIEEWLVEPGNVAELEALPEPLDMAAVRAQMP
jgi:hypothetical protein